MAAVFVDDRTVVGRALAVVEAVAELGAPTLAELAVATSLPKPTLLRTAGDLVRRGVLAGSALGYTLGPTLVRLGHSAALHQESVRYRELLHDLHRTFGGIAWLSVGSEPTSLVPVHFVAERSLARTVRSRWPASGGPSTLANTAGGQLMLAHRPELYERLCGTGITPATRHSHRDPRLLRVALQRVRDEGVALESEQAMDGWSCAAVRIDDLQGEFGTVGVAVPIGRHSAQRTVRAIVRALTPLGA